MSAFSEIAFAHGIMRAGFSPWWNPSLSCGTPLFAQPGLALGYPGTLLALLLPGALGMGAFLALHAALGFAGALRFAGQVSTRMPGALFALVYSGILAALGWRADPSYAAGLAWLPWALAAASRATSFASWAMLLSCANPASAVLGLLGAALVRQRAWRLRSAALAALAVALPIAATIQAQWLTLPAPGIRPALSLEESRVLKMKARDHRVYAGFVGAAGHENFVTDGPAWVFGSRRPLKEMAALEGSLSQAGDFRDNFLNLWGVSLALPEKGQGSEPSRLRSPVRAAFVSSARAYKPVQEIFDMEARPFFSRPLLIDGEDPRAGSGPGGAAWTMLSYENDAAGGMAVTLPEGHGAGWLYCSDAYYPGWEARSELGVRPIIRAEQAFRALWVEVGDKQVVFSYRPWLIYATWLISLLTLILSAIPAFKKAALS